MRVLVLLLALVLPTLAVAQESASTPPLQRAETAYAQGEWDRAERLAREAGGAQGYTLAAEAVLAELMTWKEGLDRPAAARRAESYARRALERDDTLVEAHLRLAAALGFRGRFMSGWRAYFAGIPQEGRDHIRTALELDPDSPWAHALWGAWNMEVVRRAGGGTFGADLERGLDHYRSAARMAPNEPGIAYHLALAQLAHDPQRFEQEAARWLDQAASAEVGEAFDKAMKQMAANLAAMLENDLQAAHEEAVYRLEN